MWNGDIRALTSFVERYKVTDVELMELLLDEHESGPKKTSESVCNPIVLICVLDESASSSSLFATDPASLENVTCGWFRPTENTAVCNGALRTVSDVVSSLGNHPQPQIFDRGALAGLIFSERPELFSSEGSGYALQEPPNRRRRREEAETDPQSLEKCGPRLRGRVIPCFKCPTAFVQVNVSELSRLTYYSSSAGHHINGEHGCASPSARIAASSSAVAFLSKVQQALAITALFPLWSDDSDCSNIHVPIDRRAIHIFPSSSPPSATNTKAYPSRFAARFTLIGETVWEKQYDPTFGAIAQSRCVSVSVPVSETSCERNGSNSPRDASHTHEEEATFLRRPCRSLRYRCIALLNADVPPIHLTDKVYTTIADASGVAHANALPAGYQRQAKVNPPTAQEPHTPTITHYKERFSYSDSSSPFSSQSSNSADLTPSSPRHLLSPARSACSVPQMKPNPFISPMPLVNRVDAKARTSRCHNVDKDYSLNTILDECSLLESQSLCSFPPIRGRSTSSHASVLCFRSSPTLSNPQDASQGLGSRVGGSSSSTSTSHRTKSTSSVSSHAVNADMTGLSLYPTSATCTPSTSTPRSNSTCHGSDATGVSDEKQSQRAVPPPQPTQETKAHKVPRPNVPFLMVASCKDSMIFGSGVSTRHATRALSQQSPSAVDESPLPTSCTWLRELVFEGRVEKELLKEQHVHRGGGHWPTDDSLYVSRGRSRSRSALSFSQNNHNIFSHDNSSFSHLDLKGSSSLSASIRSAIPFAVSLLDVRNLDTMKKATPITGPGNKMPTNRQALSESKVASASCEGSSHFVSDVRCALPEGIDFTHKRLGVSIPLFRAIRQLCDNETPEKSDEGKNSHSPSRFISNVSAHTTGSIDLTNIFVLVAECPDNDDAISELTFQESGEDRSISLLTSLAARTLRGVVEAASRAVEMLVSNNIDVCILAQRRQMMLLGKSSSKSRPDGVSTLPGANNVVPRPLQLYGPHIASSLAKIIHNSKNSKFKDACWAILRNSDERKFQSTAAHTHHARDRPAQSSRGNSGYSLSPHPSPSPSTLTTFHHDDRLSEGNLQQTQLTFASPSRPFPLSSSHASYSESAFSRSRNHLIIEGNLGQQSPTRHGPVCCDTGRNLMDSYESPQEDSKRIRSWRVHSSTAAPHDALSLGQTENMLLELLISASQAVSKN